MGFLNNQLERPASLTWWYSPIFTEM